MNKILLVLVFLTHYFRLKCNVYTSLIQNEILGEFFSCRLVEEKHKIALEKDLKKLDAKLAEGLTKKSSFYQIINAKSKTEDLRKAGLLQIDDNSFKKLIIIQHETRQNLDDLDEYFFYF